jgi:catechol 2,3-dioxygenase-like lactoylglutathione lyase family enzyme
MSSRGLAELVLIVQDVPEAARFYRDVVGLELEHETSDEWAWFWAGEPGTPQRIALHRGSLLFEEHSPFPEGPPLRHGALRPGGRPRPSRKGSAACQGGGSGRVRAHGVRVDERSLVLLL